MRVSQKLVFHQSKYISAIKRILYYRHVCILVFLHDLGIPCHSDACLKSSDVRVGVKTLHNTNL